MRDRGTALDGFIALYDGTGNSETTLHESITTKVVVDYELVCLCQEHGDRPHKAAPLGKFSELYPFDMLKRPLVAHAEEFVRQIKGKGYEPVTSIYEFQVWGPYTEKVGALGEWTPEEGNHTIPRQQRRKAARAWGYQGDELSFELGCAFLIQGHFTRHARYGHIDEQSGVILV